MRFTLPIGAVVAVALGLAACGSSSGGADTPTACLGGPAGIERLLDQPPDPTFEGFPTAGSCLVPDQPTGELTKVGSAMILAAQHLNSQGREAPDGKAPIRLGYLLGQVRRAADETGGIHDNLVGRIESSALYSPGGRPLPPAFRAGLETGEDAARRVG